jgi:hypothetical protein
VVVQPSANAVATSMGGMVFLIIQNAII